MGFIQRTFGRKVPTAAVGAEALTRLETEASAAQERVRKADAALKSIVDMTDAEHEAAIAEQAAAGRAASRAAAQVAAMRQAVSELQAAEAGEAKKRERDAVEKRLREDYPAVTQRYERAAAEAAAALTEMDAIDAEVSRINRSTAGTDLAPIETSDARYRSEPDEVEADRVVTEEKVMRRLPALNAGDEERWEDAPVTVKREGKLVLGPGEAVRNVERTIPGQTRRGRRLSSPASNAALPAARLDGKPFWPRSE